MGFWFSFFYYLVLLLLGFYVYRKLTFKRCQSAVCLVGKTAVVTGANCGIGYETALEFAKRGAKVILACRNVNKANEAVEKIVEETNNHNVSYKRVDFSDFVSIRNFAKEICESENRLDILVNNAGAGGLNGKSVDGYHLLVQTNYYGPFLLTILLLDLLKKTPSSRIVNVSSESAKYIRTFNITDLENKDGIGWINGTELYAITKFCNILFTMELANKLKGSDVTTYSLHPGTVNTEILRGMPFFATVIKDALIKPFLKSPEEGAQTTIYCSLQKGLEKYNGGHFDNCKYEGTYGSVRKAIEQDPQIASKLWHFTEKIVE